MKKMGYTGCGVGDIEARMPTNFYGPAKDAGISIIAPECEGTEGAVSYIVKNVDGVKVGIAAFNRLKADNDTYEGMKKVLAAYVAVRKASDVLIVLDQKGQINEQWLAQTGKRFGEPDIVIKGSDQGSNVDARTIGSTYVPPVFSRATELGMVTVELKPGETPKFDLQRKPLDAEIKEDEDILKLVKQDEEKRNKSVEQAPNDRPLAPEGAVKTSQNGPQIPDFYRSEACKTCHQTEYDSWAKSKHAQAVTSLSNSGKLQPECLKCHSELNRRTGMTLVSADGGVHCVSCHKTVTYPHGSDYKATGRAVESVNVCLECHDQKNSPNFDEKTYWQRIMHKAADTTKS